VIERAKQKSVRRKEKRKAVRIEKNQNLKAKNN
jgi:hypothetical protein